MSLREVDRKRGDQNEVGFQSASHDSAARQPWSEARRSHRGSRMLPGGFARELDHGMYSNHEGTSGDVDHPILLAGCA
jgi:hypothetical protein